MTLKEILDEKDVSNFLEGFKKVFGGILFIVDNVGGRIGQGCAEGGLDACTQCPISESQISLPIEVEGVTLGSLISCKAKVKKVNLKVLAEMIARLTRTERDVLSLAGEVTANYEVLSLLYEIGEIIATTFDRNKVCGSILERIGNVIGAGLGCMMLREGSIIEVKPVASYGIESRLINRLTLRAGQGTLGKVLSEGRATLITKLDPSLGLTQIDSLFSPPLLFAPIRGKGGLMGMILLARKEGGKEFTAPDLKLAQAIAVQAGSAIKNITLFKDLKEFFLRTVRTLASTIDARDLYTCGHSERVAEYSMAIGREMGMGDEEVEITQLTALLHDIGMLTIPEQILHHPEKLSEKDLDIVKQHPLQGVQIIQEIKQFEKILPGIWHHHEHYDGGGYPAGLTGEDIPINGRIIAVADAFDAMTSDRSYRKALSIKAALTEIEESLGHQFDPNVVLAFKKVHAQGKIKKDVDESEKKRLTY